MLEFCGVVDLLPHSGREAFRYCEPFVRTQLWRLLLTKASPFGRGGSRKADGEGVHDGFLIVTFDYVNKQFAVTMPPSGREGDHGVVEGECVYNEFGIVTFDYVSKRFAVIKPPLCKGRWHALA